MAVSVNALIAGGPGGVGIPLDYSTSLATVAGTATLSEQILKQIVIPAGTLFNCRYFGIRSVWTKSGTTDAATSVRIRLGTAGTTADTVLVSSTGFSAASRAYSMENFLFAFDATTLRVMSLTAINNFGNQTTTQVHPINTTVTNVQTTDLILSASAIMVGTTDTPSLSTLILTLY
jgi:hypothetical protein